MHAFMYGPRQCVWIIEVHIIEGRTVYTVAVLADIWKAVMVTCHGDECCSHIYIGRVGVVCLSILSVGGEVVFSCESEIV